MSICFVYIRRACRILPAPASYVVVLTDARPTAFLAAAPAAFVLADARSAAFLAVASSDVVLTDDPLRRIDNYDYYTTDRGDGVQRPDDKGWCLVNWA
jgi:hypothetical protein